MAGIHMVERDGFVGGHAEGVPVDDGLGRGLADNGVRGPAGDVAGLSCQMKALPCVTVPLVGAARACGARALSPAAATAASTARAPETPDFPRRRAHSLATVQHALLAFHITV